jgi:periplasmic protein TonB
MIRFDRVYKSAPWLASLALHASLLLPLIGFAAASVPEIYDAGTGQDAFAVTKGLTVEMVSLGDDVEQVVAPEAALTVTAAAPTPVIETKPEAEPQTLITSLAQSDAAAAPVIEAISPQEVQKPQEVAARDQAAEPEIITEKSAGDARDGGKVTVALNAYVGKIRGALQRVKASYTDAATAAGRVTLHVTVNASGKVVDRAVIKSSGIAALDKAAVDWLERANFPPLPDQLGPSLRLDVPLSFGRRNS